MSVPKSEILKYIWHNPETHRKQIAEHFSCRPNLVTDLVRELIQERWVRESGPKATGQGRAPIALKVDGAGKNAIAASYGMDGMWVAIVDADANILKCVESTDRPLSPQDVADRVAASIPELSAVATGDIIGIGLADPGMVDTRRGMILKSSTFPDWRDVPLAEKVAERTGLPTLVEDVTRVRALSEYIRSWDLCRTGRHMLYMDYGDGLGFSLITPSGFYRGARFASELAHVVVDPFGPACMCGARGCLESIVGATAIEKTARQRLDSGVDSSLRRRDGITAEAIFSAALDGDRMARGIVSEMQPVLGLAVAMALSAYHPHMFVVGAKTAEAVECLVDMLKAAVRDRVQPELSHDLDIRAGRATGTLALIGAALMVFDERIVRQGKLLVAPKAPVLDGVGSIDWPAF